MTETEWYEITVVYDNGVQVKFVTDEFTWTRHGSATEEVEWGKFPSGGNLPVKFGVDNVIAIWSRKL